MSPSTSARIASALFAAEAMFAVVHLLVGGGYRGVVHSFGVLVDCGLAAIWIAATVAGLVQRSGLALATMWVGAAVSLTHGFLFSVATSSVGPYGVGLPFVFAAVAQAYLIAQAAPAFRHVRAEPREAEPSAPPFGQHARTMA
jgi:hypothetical protein